MAIPYNFALDITEDDIQKAFTDKKWLDDVASATLFGVTYTTTHDITDKTPEETINDIINYNIIQRLKSVFLSKAKPLPKVIEWDNTIPLAFAYDSLENILIQSLLLKESGEFNQKISFNLVVKNDEIKKRLNTWIKTFQQLYIMFKIEIKELKTKYKITIS